MKNLAKSLFGLILYIVLIFGTAYLLGHFVVGQVEVDGPSMNDTLQDHDRVLMNKFTYRVKTLDRFDVIVFKYAYDTDTDYIKRVIGLPGETVRIDMDGNIYINDELLEEDYGKEVIEYPGIAEDGVTLGKDQYFVLGDNRNNSNDSRDPDVAAVSKSQIRGHVWLRLRPDFGLVK
ncbi:MAG: signal peptidase I [Lachnospiraceae bacterium]|nr:signal peptidase I [Lachnospiraceae bacterium]MDD7176704.1 signal peptidase I [bacterium]MDY5518024.1 signal peptidase I [Lachnospiraceae bacterium]